MRMYQFNKGFEKSIPDCDPTKYELNYNTLKEEIEYKEHNFTYSVTSPGGIKRVTINNKVLIHTNFYDRKEIKKGYFLEIIEGDFSLYKKEKISEKDAEEKNINLFGLKKTKNTRPQYYLSACDKPLILIKNKRTFLKLFSKPKNVKKYFKENNINIRNESDLKKTFDFLNNYYHCKVNRS